MPRIIRHALLEKLLKLPEVQTFIADFRTLSGLDLCVHDELGRPLVPETPQSPLCAALLASEQGREICRTTRQSLCAQAAHGPANCCCDAGLREVAVPLRAADHTIGYLVFRGVLPQPSSTRELHRIRHLLAKARFTVQAEDLAELHRSCGIMDDDVLRAYQRVIAMACRQFTLQVADHFMDAGRPLPALAHKARNYIVAHGIGAPCRLQEIARECKVSTAHLSRVFHAATGLTVTEYLSRSRVEHALGLLKRNELSVTEIAFASGFQSLSQFNRTFRKYTGRAPSQIYKAGRNRSGSQLAVVRW